MEPQDFGKLVYQSEFGPEHMVPDRRRAEAFLSEEWRTLPADSGPRFPEPVSDALCRFPLSACGSEEELELLLELFLLTAGEYRGNGSGLEEKLGRIAGLEVRGMREWVSEWRERGCPSVHHSQVYREKYRPHYRLIRREYGGFFAALSKVQGLTGGDAAVVIAIDGRCGSGKTFLAELIQKLFPCNVCHMDDFYMPPGQRQKNWTELPAGNMDLKRFRDEVLRPVRAGEQAVYRPYSCEKGRMGEERPLPPCKLTVVEGSYSHHPLLSEAYDLKIFLTCGREERIRRLRVREGDCFPVFERQWIPMEENYLGHYSIEENSDLAVDTTGQIS